MHNGSRSKVGVSLTLAAAQNGWSVLEAIRLARRFAPRAHKTIRPADLLQVGNASSLIGKHSLKFQQTRRGRLDHPQTLRVVALGVNRIGMEQTFAAKVLRSFEAITIQPIDSIKHSFWVAGTGALYPLPGKRKGYIPIFVQHNVPFATAYHE